VIKCALCRKDGNDFGEKFDFYTKNEEGGIISLRCLCDQCAQKIKVRMIIWSDHISNVLLKKNQEKQSHSCENCEYIGRLLDFIIEGKNDLKCPNCNHIKKVIAMGNDNT